MPCAAAARITRCKPQNAPKPIAVLLTPTTPKRTIDTSERRRTSADKPDEFKVGGVDGLLISAETGPFCSIGRKPRAAFELLPTRGKMGNTFEMAMTTTSSGLQYEDTREGQGASPTKGQTCVMHYTGWLWVDGKKGDKFDSSVDRGRPFTFPIGAGRVIKGWDEGVASMKIGGTRSLLIPAELGYGAAGAGGVIPPNATLLFEVELLGVQ
jgi:peptidylprolyl isomerase